MSVKNFRSIKNSTITFKDIMAIVGENNSGKTALLRAINSVFNWQLEYPFFLDKTHQYKPRTNTIIELVFKGIPNKEIYKDKTINNELTIIFTYNYKSQKKKICYKTKQDVKPLEDNFIDQLKEDIDYVYIPVNRSNNDLIWTDNSIFKRLLIAYSKYYNEKRDNISRQVQQVADTLKKTVFSKLEKEIRNVSMLDKDDKYHLGYNSSIDYTIFLDKVVLNLINHQKFPITEYGSGIKSLSVIAFYRVLAQIEGMNVILGIEEPETNLHPQAQKKLISSIKNNRQSTEVQAIMATHSTVIIDELNHDDIILATRKEEDQRGFCTDYNQLSDDFWNKNNLDEYKHHKFFKFKNSEFFFSRYVILAESPTDVSVISHLIDNKIGDNKFSISILNVDGCKNLKYPYFLLKSLKIPFSMVIDHDVITPYLNSELKKSRNKKNKLPLYKNEIKENDPVIDDLWSSKKMEQLKQIVKKSYTQLYDFCSQNRVYVMQYCLEMDLVANNATRKKFCDKLNITFDDSSSYEKLLIDNEKNIKNIKNIIEVISDLPQSDYPYSYKKIRNSIINDINHFLGKK